MIGYTMVGTQNLDAAKSFYGPLFKLMGLEPCFEDEQVASWGKLKDDTIPRFFVCHPYDGKPASVGNGAMTTFRVSTASLVKELHDQALSSGATSEGAPGFRPDRYGDKFYVAYARDLDGNKIAFACYDGKANP